MSGYSTVQSKVMILGFEDVRYSLIIRPWEKEE